jgi:hypothetical protein
VVKIVKYNKILVWLFYNTANTAKIYYFFAMK